MVKKTFLAKLDQLYLMLELIEKQTNAANFNKSDIGNINLAAEEMLVNIINYAYKNSKKEGRIDIECSFSNENELKIVFKDRGVPFNPLITLKGVDVDTLVKDRHVGGFGIFLSKRAMDEIFYERKGGENILIMTKRKKN